MSEASAQRRPGGKLFRKYIMLFVALVGGTLLASGALEVWFSYQEHKTALARIQQEKVDPHLLLREIMGNLKAASENAIGLMRRAVETMSQRREQLAACPARHALELGIWSDKSRVAPEEIERLAPLWGKYFGK